MGSHPHIATCYRTSQLATCYRTSQVMPWYILTNKAVLLRVFFKIIKSVCLFIWQTRVSFIMGLFWVFNFQLSDFHYCAWLYCTSIQKSYPIYLNGKCDNFLLWNFFIVEKSFWSDLIQKIISCFLHCKCNIFFW